MTTRETEASRSKLVFKKSTLAVCIAALTAAQAYGQDTAENPVALEEVVVYGMKQSLENAQDIKRQSSIVQDVITASDIGALPDKSVVEALQRVPGVAIERFEASNDPDHFSVEGGNITVRGLNRVRGEINGRDGFSATGDGGLNYSDIPPEMVGAVIVKKSQSANTIEGGVSGTINIETRKPFDSDGFVLGGSVKASYADLIDEVKPSASVVVGNVWDSEIGSIGALLSVAYSEFSSRGDGVGVFNYKQVTNAGSNPDNVNLFAPLGGSARQQENNRERLGIAGSLQWANPSESVQATLEFIRSDSTLTWTEHFLEFPAEPFSNDAGSANLNLGAGATYNCLPGNQPCLFTSGRILGGTGNPSDETDIAFRGNPYYVAGVRTREDERVVDDLSLNVQFKPNDNLTLTGDLQYARAMNKVMDFTVHGRINSTDAYLDLRNSDKPVFDILDNNNGQPVSDASSYFMRSAMDHAADSEGDEKAISLDGKYTFDQGLISSVEAGFRFSNRTIDFKESLYNWGSLGETWMGSPAKYSEYLNSGMVEQFTFKDHLGGSALTVNDTFYFPSASLLRNTENFYQQVQASNILMDDGTWQPLHRRSTAMEGSSFRPAELATVEEDRSSVYLQLNFGSDDSAIRFSGDVGLRYVNWQLNATGANVFGAADGVFTGETEDFVMAHPWGNYWVEPVDWQQASESPTLAYYTTRFYDAYVQEATDAGAADPAAAATARIQAEVNAVEAARAALRAEVGEYIDQLDGPVYSVKGDKFTRVLPSFNLKLELTEDLIVRFAASESIFLPTLNNVRNTRLVTPNLEVKRFTNPDTGAEESRIESVELTGYVANGGGNPLLQPELATNYDLTFEWYFEDLGSVTTSLFHKRIRDYFRQSTVLEELTNTRGNTELVAVTSTQNAGTATVKGAELAYQGTFGFIHDSLESFGIQASYTYIDGSSRDYGNANYGGDPNNKYAQQYTFNNIRDLPLEGLSKDNYNLVLFFDNNTFEGRLAYNWRSSYLLNSRDVIAYAPVYGESTGQLDASFSYRITDQFRIGLEANNLLDEVTRTSIQNETNPGSTSGVQETVRSPRSYFVNDRRLALSVNFTF
jgi:iron complex outermembrane receptor protein